MTFLDPVSLRIHSLIESSTANGPGTRAVLWVQGCTLGCPGCFNPQTHSLTGGFREEVHALASRIVAWRNRIDGLTVSGGEPLLQIGPVTALLLEVRKVSNLSVLLFTGFEWYEVKRMPGAVDLLAQLDILVAGRFEAEHRLGSGLIGSTNQSVHFLTDRYGPSDLASTPEAEVTIGPDGSLVSTGIDPVRLPPR